MEELGLLLAVEVLRWDGGREGDRLLWQPMATSEREEEKRDWRGEITGPCQLPHCFYICALVCPRRGLEIVTACAIIK